MTTQQKMISWKTSSFHTCQGNKQNRSSIHVFRYAITLTISREKNLFFTLIACKKVSKKCLNGSRGCHRRLGLHRTTSRARLTAVAAVLRPFSSQTVAERHAWLLSSRIGFRCRGCRRSIEFTALSPPYSQKGQRRPHKHAGAVKARCRRWLCSACFVEFSAYPQQLSVWRGRPPLLRLRSTNGFS